MKIPKMCLKQSFSHLKWVLQSILSLTVLSNYVSRSSNFDITFLSDCTTICSVFFLLCDRKFNEESKNVLKIVIFSLKVGLTSNYVSDCQAVLKRCKNQDLENFSCSIRNKT